MYLFNKFTANFKTNDLFVKHSVIINYITCIVMFATIFAKRFSAKSAIHKEMHTRLKETIGLHKNQGPQPCLANAVNQVK